MHDITDLKGMNPIIKFSYPKHIAADVLTFVTLS
jgi:hypothetical protein